MVHEVIASHPVQPSCEGALSGIETPQRLKNFDKDFLREVLGFRGPPRETIA